MKIQKITVGLYDTQINWARKNHFSLSSLLREILGKEIKRRGG